MQRLPVFLRPSVLLRRFPVLCGRRCGEEDEPLQVVDEVFEADVGVCARAADGAHELAAHRGLPSEDMLDPCANL